MIIPMGIASLACVRLDASKVEDAVYVVDSGNVRPFEKCKTFSFRYIEIENTLHSEVYRYIEIFMDSKAFNEENLKEMFSYLSREYPNEANLVIRAYTDWSQIDYPSDCPPSGIGGGKGKPKPEEFHFQATFNRRPEGAYFRYRETPMSKDLRTVVIE